ncbi:MAG: MaoC family dehydratase N-terminal domain-containing protein [Aeromicrobium sp.]|uniref:FAS1-like dehydratase domain-containing protein n=1 Tax=Aeromicrobium sp. TaxID=1871063 RepID=UPI00260A2A34|nr:MaoC family dehydratase N-terminal domain-containing protein [Aeromicrobium sp.]MDF1704922.1 MaoC family dehydratase N-terminal domain-containing protein [Aeromicrobium sp.]
MTSGNVLVDDLAGRLAAAHRREWVDVQVVDPAEARAYAELHGYGPDVAHVPPGYGAALTMRAVLLVLHDQELALPFDRNVHAAQDLEWMRTMRPGETLRTVASVTEIKVRERAVFFDVVTRTDGGDGPVLRGVATQAVRHA